MNNPLINNPVEINSREIQSIIEAGRVPTIQFSKPGYTPELLQELNRLCIELGDRIEVRFYGHYGDHFDAAVLADLPDVRWLSVDCLTAVANERQIGELPLLERLSFGVFRFDDPPIPRADRR